MKLEPMTPPAVPVMTPRIPEPPVEACFASRLNPKEAAGEADREHGDEQHELEKGQVR